MKKWYAVYVNVRHEKKVVTKLAEYGVEAYSPIVKKLQQWSDRKKWVEFPMLSGYVFVRIVLNQDKEKVTNHPSVFGFIKFEGIEATIKENEIAVLKSIEETGYDVTQESEQIKLSDSVVIMQGPLKGLMGQVVRIQDEDFVRLELTSIKQNVTVKVPKQILQIQKLKADAINSAN